MNADDFVVHEWGTFTTVQGSNGKMLSGLYREEEHLPGFVYHHAGFSPDPAVQKGLYRPADNVTVKMETPVVYFYSKGERQANIKVDFPNGSISQWYPERQKGEEAPGTEKLDFQQPYEGWIEWDCKVLNKNTEKTINTNPLEETNTWTAPRATDANLVESPNGQVEKFLFYRGIGNFETTVSLSFEEQQLKIENTSSETIPYVFVYEKWDNEDPVVWWTGSLDGKGTKKVSEPTSGMSEMELEKKFLEFTGALVDEGLYEKEAVSMLKTWHESYFNSYGIKVFWIVPRSITDEVLPIEVSPAPTELERVLVGRSEILTPEFEAQLVKDIHQNPINKWANDRYYLAYQERVDDMTTPVGSSSLDATMTLEVFPNPNQGHFTITGFMNADQKNALIQIFGMNGSEMLIQSSQTVDNGRLLVGAEGLSKGVYTLRVTVAGKTSSTSLVIE